MEKIAVQLPRAAIVEAALRSTTGRLAAELASPQDQAPTWNEFEWRTAMAVSVMHGISALLARRLRWTGPRHWQAFLSEQVEQGLLREQRTRELLNQLDLAARQANVSLLAMKGSALIQLGLYEPGSRPMSDVDLLVRPEDFNASQKFLLAIGYVEGLTTRRHTEYAPRGTSSQRAFGEHATNPIKVELHAAVTERLPIREIDITRQLFPHNAHPGLNSYPSSAALMRHLLLHAAGNLCGHGIRLIHLHDIAALAGRLKEHDWNSALAAASDNLPAWWAVPPLELAMRLFPDRWPLDEMGPALTTAKADCPSQLLRITRRSRLEDVSLSGFRVPAFPGIAWSHNLHEAIACLRSRLHPGHEILHQRRHAEAPMRTIVNAAWVRRARWHRALRYLFGRPPRVATLYSLQRALAYTPAHTNS